MSIFLKCREARPSEINLLVDAFRLTLEEIDNKDIIPTERTLNCCQGLLISSYAKGCVSYLAEVEGQAVGYLVFLADDIGFDLNKNSITILTLYVEPQFRYLGIGKFLIDSVELELKERKVDSVCISLQGIKYLPKILSRWNKRKIENYQVFLA